MDNRYLSLPLAVALGLASPCAVALGLGQLQVKSGLNQLHHGVGPNVAGPAGNENFSHG